MKKAAENQRRLPISEHKVESAWILMAKLYRSVDMRVILWSVCRETYKRQGLISFENIISKWKCGGKESMWEAVYIPMTLLPYLVRYATPVQFVSAPTILNIDSARRIPENIRIVTNIVVEA